MAIVGVVVAWVVKPSEWRKHSLLEGQEKTPVVEEQEIEAVDHEKERITVGFVTVNDEMDVSV